MDKTILDADKVLETQKTDVVLVAINKIFSKLQDTLRVAMWHVSLLAAVPSGVFLKEINFYVKADIPDLIESCQLCSKTRNLAVQDNEIQYATIATYFTTLQPLIPLLYMSASLLLYNSREIVDIEPKQEIFL